MFDIVLEDYLLQVRFCLYISSHYLGYKVSRLVLLSSKDNSLFSDLLPYSLLSENFPMVHLVGPFLALKRMLQVMHAQGILVHNTTPTGDSLWELTWLHVQTISPSLQPDMFAETETVAEVLEGPAVEQVQSSDGTGVVEAEAGSQSSQPGIEASTSPGE